MQLWVGLGNPGASYAQNRHNAGFLAMDALAQTFRAPPWSKKFNALITEINFSNPPLTRGQKGGSSAAGDARPAAETGRTEQEHIKVLLLKPQQYMNCSGQAVGQAMRFYKLDPDQVTIFHDELDLPPEKLRVKTGGGHGGHNGLRDIDAHIGREYRRVRLGIGHPGDKDRVTDYVLSDFSATERAALEKWLAEIAVASPLLAGGRETEFMTRLAQTEV